ncbi:hypothetical protein M758_N003300 [Ceratodon purpureus]|nr:hypothetical protein M758_N003300 [Ceratodon purpureus]
MSSAIPLMASLAEQQPSQGEPPKLEEGAVRRRQVGAAAPAAAPEAFSAALSESGKKGLEDGIAGNKLVSLAEIGKHKSESDLWVVVDGVVYDISRFVDTHPGGVEVILEYMHLKDVGKLMRGEEGDTPSSHSHSHSNYAFRMLQQFRIGLVTEFQRSNKDGASLSDGSEEKRYVVDLNKPLVFQVGKLGADYDRWVHDPIVQKEPPRFFESDIAEFFTRTAWWVIPAVWVPVVMYMAMEAHNQGIWLSVMPLSMVAGAFIWTFVEYLLHRYVFHMKTSSYWTNTAHYFLHGFHHKHPMDGTRLVFPPAITAIIVCIIWYLTEPLVYILTPPVKLSMFSGGLLAYVAYDLTHYFLHFGTPYNQMSRMMKRFHLNHHFREQSNSYGVTTPFWDTVFGTFPQHANQILGTRQ